MLGWLHRRAENVAAFLLALVFAAFILQVVFRYLLNLPSGWASELTVTAWLWLVLWGAAFVLREKEEIRFDILTTSVGKRTRAVMALVTAVVLLVVYAASFPAVYDFVSFMKIQKTTYLKIRYDHLFSIYLLFVAAILVKYVVISVRSFGSVIARAPKKGDAK
ncbi:TRAP transporter small permease subunit [uncultured Roseibium sp.]|uniref:TRAP transporter small permease n=1 Tax=uncultured Roseibium sp. TaxID=1936171 RepID=UPI003216A7A1